MSRGGVRTDTAFPRADGAPGLANRPVRSDAADRAAAADAVAGAAETRAGVQPSARDCADHADGPDDLSHRVRADRPFQRAGAADGRVRRAFFADGAWLAVLRTGRHRHRPALFRLVFTGRSR